MPKILRPWLTAAEKISSIQWVNKQTLPYCLFPLVSCFLFVFGQIVCARESLQTHIAGFVDFLLLCLWSTIAFNNPKNSLLAVSKERIVQTQNFVFGRFSNFFFYPNEIWTHPPTSNFFLDFWNFFNFAKPLSCLRLSN